MNDKHFEASFLLGQLIGKISALAYNESMNGDEYRAALENIITSATAAIQRIFYSPSGNMRIDFE